MCHFVTVIVLRQTDICLESNSKIHRVTGFLQIFHCIIFFLFDSPINAAHHSSIRDYQYHVNTNPIHSEFDTDTLIS